MHVELKVTLAGQRYLDMAHVADPSIFINPLSNHLSSCGRQPKETITEVLLLRTALLLRLAAHIYQDKITELRTKEGSRKAKKSKLPFASHDAFNAYVDTLIKAHQESVKSDRIATSNSPARPLRKSTDNFFAKKQAALVEHCQLYYNY